MSELLALAERVERLTQSSRIVDLEIQIAVFGDAIWPATDMQGRVTNPNSRMSDYLSLYRDVIDQDDQDFDFARYTKSIDAAKTLLLDWMSVEYLKSAAPASSPELRFTRLPHMGLASRASRNQSEQRNDG